MRGTVTINSILGLVFISLGVIVGATFVPTVVQSLFDASQTAGITTAASSMTNIGQLIGVIAMTVAPAIAGLYMIFKDVKSD